MIRLTGLAPRIVCGVAAGLALSCSFGAQAFGDKESDWNALVGLAAQLAEIKPLIGQDAGKAALYSQLQEAYNELRQGTFIRK